MKRIYPNRPRLKKKPQRPPESIGLLESVFSSIDAAIAYVDLNLCYVYVNQSFINSAGVRPTSLLGKCIFDTLEDTGGHIRNIFDRVLASGRPYFGRKQPFPFVGTAGIESPYWDWSLQAQKNAAGNPQGFFLLAIDNAVQYQSENEVRESRALFEHLFESDPDANVLVDENGKIISVNHQTEQDFGYTRDELINQPVERLLPTRFHFNHAHHRASYLEDPQQRPMGAGYELFARRKDGSEFPVDVKLSPLKTESGVLTLAVVRDLTFRKQMEAELNEMQHRLLESVEAERLRLAQDLHDGPIQDLYGAIYRLQIVEGEMFGRAAQSEVVEMRSTLTSVIDTLRETCSELRPSTLVPFGLQKAITSDVDRFRPNHPELQVHTELMRDGKMLPEHVRLALFRIYRNLLSNVVRHASAQNVTIRLILDAEQVVMEVEDDGVGFNTPSRWIDMARRGHLGLAGVNERAEAIGGRVEIESEPGTGTLVRTIIPQQAPEVQIPGD